MTPRSYTLGKREGSSAATRQRIWKAALELYLERGIAGTTIQAVAEHADVARGTVVNHFGTAEQLLEAVLDEVTADLRYPDEHIFDGIADPAERIRHYVAALFRFFERSESVWPAFSSELELPALKRRETEFYVVLGRLYAAGFGALAGDRVVAASARAFVNYGPLHDLRAAGLSLDEAIDVVADALIALVEGRPTEHVNTQEVVG